MSRVEFSLTGAGYDQGLLGVGTRTWGGWIHNWDTTSVRNGTYTLHGVAFDPVGNAGPSAGLTVTVQNGECE